MLHLHNKHGSFLDDYVDAQIQPNAIDLRLDKVFEIKNNLFAIDEVGKSHRGSSLIQPDLKGYWWLEPGVYEVVMQGKITIGEGEAGWVITRSSLNRNGVFLTSGLYDSKYVGPMSAAMHVTTGRMSIQKGTRVGQFLLFEAEMLFPYNGSYGYDEEGNIKKTDTLA